MISIIGFEKKANFKEKVCFWPFQQNMQVTHRTAVAAANTCSTKSHHAVTLLSDSSILAAELDVDEGAAREDERCSHTLVLALPSLQTTGKGAQLPQVTQRPFLGRLKKHTH